MNAFVSPTPVITTGASRASISNLRSTFVSPVSRGAIRRVAFPSLPAVTTKASLESVATKTALESAVCADLVKLYDSTPCMPIMVRLAWHDAGTYNVNDKTGGANASIRFSPESGHDANNGLNIAMGLLEPIKQAHPEISYADLYQLASIVAIEYSGGPTIPFRLGRKDAAEAECTPDGRLPDATKGMGHLRDIFYRMGLNDTEITVLSGAHTLGRCHPDRSGFDGPWTKVPVKFDNSYFIEILKDVPDPDLLRLTSDLALLDTPETKQLCEKYASDQDAFFEDYISAHQKLSELGCFA